MNKDMIDCDIAMRVWAGSRQFQLTESMVATEAFREGWKAGREYERKARKLDPTNSGSEPVSSVEDQASNADPLIDRPRIDIAPDER